VLELYGVTVTEDVVTVVSELITNAVKVSRPGEAVTLRLLIDDETVLVAVHDESDELPELRDVPVDETQGRGLLIVEALSGGDCGYTLGAYGGKTVWALITNEA
jgi:two-component sensor histidine kinase